VTSLLRAAASARSRLRRAVVVLRIRLTAAARRARLDLDIAPDVDFGRGFRVAVAPGARATLRIGSGCRVHGGVLMVIHGGEALIGPRCEIRQGTVITLSGGRLVLEEGNKLSYYNVVHCAAGVLMEAYASTAEHVSIVDSTHHHDGEHAVFYENTSSAPISIGKNAWLCNKASVLMGVRVGANAVVASHAVALHDVPDGMVVGGVPARVLGPRPVSGPALEFFDAEPVLGS
jgi:acetyltransferase-like isoleucine patch superfamily enzyme